MTNPLSRIYESQLLTETQNFSYYVQCDGRKVFLNEIFEIVSILQ